MALRGGSWLDRPKDCRSTYRSHGLPVRTHSFIGFRVVCLPQPIYHITMENLDIEMITIPAGEFVMGKIGRAHV